MEIAPIIELRAVAKYYGATAALHNINLEIANGEFLTLLGPSGCGKTTILRLISGFESPSRGELLLNGQDITGTPPEKRQVNTVFQNYALFPHMTVWDNVAFGLKMQRLPKTEVNWRVAEVLRRVHMDALADRKPSQLSGGQQQRVAIARAIVNNPLVLLLDEPFSALDFKLRKQMQLEIKHLQRQLGITFVFVTHDQEEAFAMSDRVVVMNEGEIRQIGSSQEIYEEPENLFVARFVGEINVLEGKITALRPDGTYMANVEGEEFVLRTKRDYEVGEKVKVLLRPEDLKVYLEQEKALAPPFFLGRIVETVYKGATVDIMLTLDNGKDLQAAEFFNEDDTDISYRPGDRVAVSWVEGWEVVLDEEGE
ncbi:spermidine/putrescine ABC transporter ATP-binding protein PotA [Desulfovibrio sp. OttesenSCG-928-A18]|nr:spermidine/putrescine ABC transporter ATP-binding protein PotA [Desulfovibrio sp. OttesenSCG-928-A18]